MTDQQPAKPNDAYAELGRIDFSETDLATVLAKVADLARRTIPDADEVSITLVGPGGAHTAAFTGERAMTVDDGHDGRWSITADPAVDDRRSN